MASLMLKNGTAILHGDGDTIEIKHHTDIRIEGNKIAYIGENLDVPSGDTTVIDCTDKIISPGFIDTHSHLWMSQLKARHAEDTLFEYVCSGGLQNYNLEPEDIYWGQLGGCIESIDAGTTTVVDHAHMTNTPDHAEKAISATIHSGLRSFYCYTPIVRYKSWSPLVPDSDLLPAWMFEQLGDLAKRQPLGQGRVKMGFGWDMWFLPKDKVVSIWEQVRSMGVNLFTTHYCKNRIFGLQSIPEKMHDFGLLGADLKDRVIISHATQASDNDVRIISESGAHISATPDSEGSMAMGSPLSFRDNAPVALGTDGHFVGPADMMSQMRLALQHARQKRNQGILDEDKFPRENLGSSVQAFNLGTIVGARAVGLEDQIGSIAPGKLADLVVFDATSPSMICAAQHDPVTAIVRHASIRDIDTVIVDGAIRKQEGRLLPVKVTDDKTLLWREIADSLAESRVRYSDKLAEIDIGAGMQSFKKLAGIDDSHLL